MSALEHGVCVVVHKGFRGHVQVAEHGVGLPTLKDTSVDAAKEHGHCSTGAEQACINLLGPRPTLHPRRCTLSQMVCV